MSAYNGGDLTFDSLNAPAGWSYEFLGTPEDAIIASGPTYENSLRFGWPIEEPGNQQVARINTNPLGNTSYTKMCQGAVFRVVPGWQHHPSGDKLFYPYAYDSVDGEARPFELTLYPHGDGSQFTIRAQMYTTETPFTPRIANIANTAYDHGAWVQALLCAEYLGPSPDAQTSRLRWWTRVYVGSAWSAWTLNADWADVKMGKTGTSTGYWKNPQFNLFWGGGTETLPSTQYFDLNRLRVSLGA